MVDFSFNKGETTNHFTVKQQIDTLHVCFYVTTGQIKTKFDNKHFDPDDILRRTSCKEMLTSLHEGVEERGVGEEEQVRQQLRRDLAVHLESVEQMQSRLQNVQDMAESHRHAQLTALGERITVQQLRQHSVHTLTER